MQANALKTKRNLEREPWFAVGSADNTAEYNPIKVWKASRRLLVQSVGGVKINELQINLSFIQKIIYAHNNAFLPILLPSSTIIIFRHDGA